MNTKPGLGIVRIREMYVELLNMMPAELGISYHVQQPSQLHNAHKYIKYRCILNVIIKSAPLLGFLCL